MNTDTLTEEEEEENKEEKERLRELLLEVFMNFDEISDTKEFTYTNLFDFDDTRYLYNLNYELSNEDEERSEWEFAGFKNEFDFVIYKTLSFETIDLPKK